MNWKQFFLSSYVKNFSSLLAAALLVATGLTLAIALPSITNGTVDRDFMAGDDVEIPTTQQLVRELRSDEDALVRRRAAWWLGEHESARGVGILIESGLRDEAADVRLVSAWALGEIKDSEAIEALIAALDDEDPLVREMAALALGEIENPQAVEALVGALDDDEDLRGAVIWALGEIGGGKATRAREEAIAEWNRTPWENEQVWTGHLEGNKWWRFARRRDNADDAEAVQTMIDQLRSSDADERRSAAQRLGTLGMSHCVDTILAVDPLLNTLRDPDAEVRAMAVWSLDEINPSRWHGLDHGHAHSDEADDDRDRY
jgi:HEAT repeat protein